MLEKEQHFKTACGVCGKDFDKPQFPEQQPQQANVTQVIICEPCLMKHEKGEGEINGH